VVAKACGATLTYPQDGVSYIEDYYDGSSALGAAPTAGDLTQVRSASRSSPIVRPWLQAA
jgi:hypothetical protein